MPSSYYKILFLLSVIMCSSCGVEVENDKRILVKGIITDDAGNALSNISVRTEVSGYDLGTTRSNASGNFELISLETDSDYLDVVINLDKALYSLPENPSFFSIRFQGHTENRPKPSLYDLGTVVLKKTAEFTLVLNNVPGDSNSLDYGLSYSTPYCEIPLNDINAEAFCNFGNSLSGNLIATSENEEYTITIIPESTLSFTYGLNGGAYQTIEIPLTNPQTTYVFEY